MNIEQEKMIVEALPSLYPLQEFEEKAIQTILDALPSAKLGTNLAEVGTDYISRQAALDAIRDMQAFEDDNGQPYLYLYDVMAVFTDEEELPPIQPEPHWIPVTERLPKKDGNYLVSGKWGSGKEAVGDCLFSVEDGYFQTAWNFDVLAWCELPEPYKGVTE